MARSTIAPKGLPLLLLALTSCGGADCSALGTKADASWRQYRSHQLSSAAEALRAAARGCAALGDRYPATASEGAAGQQEIKKHLDNCAQALAACDAAALPGGAEDPGCAAARNELQTALDAWDAVRADVASALAASAGDSARDEAFAPLDALRVRAADASVRATEAGAIDAELRAGKGEGDAGRRRSGLSSMDQDASGFLAASTASREFSRQCHP
jgi:hypothetical protein